MVERLVLVDLHTGANIALTMQEEGEGTGYVLTVREQTENEIDGWVFWDHSTLLSTFEMNECVYGGQVTAVGKKRQIKFCSSHSFTLTEK